MRAPVNVPDGFKHCPKCRETTPVTDFARASRQSGGRASWCGRCKYGLDNEARLLKTYGISTADRDRLVQAQGGLCAICGTEPAVHVDHDHASGEVRGVLCFRCNVGIGHFRDDPDVVMRALHHLLVPAATAAPAMAGATPVVPDSDAL